jgi:hypothetical protein
MPKTWERYTDFAAWEAAKSAAKDADIAADAAREAKTAAAASEPDPRTTIVGELARGEASARLRIGPRRNKWRDLVSFDDRLAAVDVRQAGLREKLQEVQQRLNDEPARHAAELAVWHADGQVGEKPPAVTPSLEASLLALTADVAHLERERLLRERADHVAKHRKQLAADVAKEVAAARARYESHIGGIEAARSDLLDMRATPGMDRFVPARRLAVAAAVHEQPGAGASGGIRPGDPGARRRTARPCGTGAASRGRGNVRKHRDGRASGCDPRHQRSGTDRQASNVGRFGRGPRARAAREARAARGVQARMGLLPARVQRMTACVDCGRHVKHVARGQRCGRCSWLASGGVLQRPRFRTRLFQLLASRGKS